MSKPRTGAPKRVAVGLLAGALAMFGVALAPPAGAVASVDNERLAGATRYGTAAAIAGDEAFSTVTTAIVATGQNFPDALAASSLAGANAAAPIILTETNNYTQEAKAGLAALKGKGVSALTIVGGTAAVSEAVETAIKGDGFTVSRIAGDDRYETAAEIAAAANTKSPAAPIAGLKAALIATGTNFPDALAGGPAAYANKLPLLLVNDTVPASTANAISTLGIKKVYILGGTAAVSSAVEGQLVVATGNPATRLAGTDRFSTAAAVGDFEAGTLGFPVTSAILATGTNFPDALAAGPLGGQLKAPIVLTASLPQASKDFLDKYSKTITKLYVSGGTSAIDAQTVTDAEAAAETVNNDVPANQTVTSRPELVSAAVRGTVTTGVLQGTTVRYTFDEALSTGTATANLFHLVAGDGTRTDGTNVAAVTGDPNSVDVLFPITSTATAAQQTVATIDTGAVSDTTGAGSTEGDAQLGATGTSTTPLAAGTTPGPDLTAVQNFRAATSTLTFVDFVFDEATSATATPTNTFRLVALNGTSEVVCNYDSGQGTATIVTTCPNAVPGVALSAASYARGTVDAGTVTDGTSDNPQQAADISNSGNTGSPDLVSATLNLNGTGNDLVTLVFDENVATAGALATFQAYLADNATTEVNPINYSVSGTTPANVLLSFADGALTQAVGVSVDDGAVVSVGGATPGTANQQDEVGFANSSTTSTTAGRTAGPDLTGVRRAAASDIFGTPTGGFTFTFTFDEDVSAAGGTFVIYLADGTRQVLGGCTALTIGNGGTEDTDNSVRCTTYGSLPNASAGAAVLGAVDNSAVTAEDAGVSNPEGAEVIAS